MTQKTNGPVPTDPPVINATSAAPGTIRFLGMNDQTWSRHASPWSVYTRMATLPFLLLAIWSHSWLGPGPSFGLTAGVLIWLWLNPRIFPAPANKSSWAARATFGERVWLNQKSVPIPKGENKQALILSAVSGVGFMAAVYGALITHPILTITGAIVTYVGKIAFLDRMVTLYDQMRDAHPLYRFWSSTPANDDQMTAGEPVAPPATEDEPTSLSGS